MTLRKKYRQGLVNRELPMAPRTKRLRLKYRRIDILERTRQSLMQDAVGRAAWAYWEELSRQNPKLKELAQKLPR
ncbi:MAG: hypothetical protein IIV00_00530 [Peptococcaceae bacterium]|nr:hypothetical protein [Peptococcaceae bacterium]